MPRRGLADLGVKDMMLWAARAVDIEDGHIVMLLCKYLQHADNGGQPHPAGHDRADLMREDTRLTPEVIPAPDVGQAGPARHGGRAGLRKG